MTHRPALAERPVWALIVNGTLDQYVESHQLAQREALVLRAQGYRVSYKRFDSWTDAYAWEDSRA